MHKQSNFKIITRLEACTEEYAQMLTWKDFHYFQENAHENHVYNTVSINTSSKYLR